MSAQPASPAAPVRIPTPPEFPVTWTTPDDERLLWTQDRMHAPEPVTPLDSAIWLMAYEGLNPAGEDYELPIRARAHCFHSYLYMAVVPVVPPDQMEAQGKRAEERLQEAMGRLETSWNDEWLPEIKSHLAWWASFDLRGASTPSLVAHLEETTKRLRRLWHLHFRIVLPVYMAMSLFDDLYRDLFGDTGFDSYKMLQGFENKTLAAGQALGALARKARTEPELQSVFQRHQPANIMDALEQTSSGRAFQDELRQYLETYGQRGDKWGVAYRTWIEDPTPVLNMLKDYTASDTESDHSLLAAERDRAVAAVNERLSGYPEDVRKQFAFLLKAAQMGSILSEDHGFWIDFCSMYRVRCVFLEVGRRLAEAGVLATADDVFYLTLDEVLDVEGTMRHGDDRRRTVVEREAELERCRQLHAPPVLGTDYGPPPDDPINRFLMKFFGGPPPASDVPGVLRGHAGSPGKVIGTARVILSLEDAQRLHKGDILVTDTTAPPWTPLFATAGGIVTDTGGILSHCAVVAREYRIPAVVGTGGSTAIIKDGQLIEVDGDAGAVRIIDRQV